VCARLLKNNYRNVRYWPKADIPSCTAHVRSAGYASMRLINVGSSPAAFELFTLRDTGYICSDL
jgi:hypothetical protein